ncbi:hypothetical protein SLS62_005403 [Diatrype stigma]|uniref:2EXR domain-containing protein n=1 Tax=Diatrype stigma TaxID=117547 RepID=A0AAN9UP77_9PEZI
MADHSFGAFPLMTLLPEIREMIWKASIFPRVMSADYPGDPERSSPMFKAPVVAHICRESREVAMRTGRLYRILPSGTKRILHTWFDTEHDTLFFDSSISLVKFLGQFEFEFQLAVQHVFSGIRGFPHSDARHLDDESLGQGPFTRIVDCLWVARSFERQVMARFPHLKTLYSYLIWEKDEDGDDVDLPSCDANASLKPISSTNAAAGPPCPHLRTKQYCHRWAPVIAAMPCFDGHFELHPAKPREARVIRYLIERDVGCIDIYCQRVGRHIAYEVVWKLTGMDTCGDWIRAEWGRTPVTMAQDDLVLLHRPVSQEHRYEERGFEVALMTVEGRQDFYPIKTDHPWVKACLARMPELRFVLTL